MRGSKTRPKRVETTRTRNTIEDIPMVDPADFYYAKPMAQQEREVRSQPTPQSVTGTDEPRAPNTGLTKSEALSIIDEVLGKEDPLMMVMYDKLPAEKIMHDEMAYVQFVRSQYLFLESIDTHMSDYLSEVEFTLYSVYILRAFQMSRNGNANQVSPNEARELVSTLVGVRYPKIYDEYFRNLGLILDRDGHKFVTSYEHGLDPRIQISGETLLDLVTVAHDPVLYALVLNIYVNDFQMEYLRNISRGTNRRWQQHQFVPGARLTPPFNYVDTNVIKTVNVAMNRVVDKYTFEQMNNLIVSAPQNTKNKAALIFVNLTDQDLEIESKSNDSGEEVAAAALFRYHTPLADGQQTYPLRWRRERDCVKRLHFNVELVYLKMFEKMSIKR
jgi:hypothetical protein